MKNIFRSVSFYTLFAAAALWGCNKDKVDPTINISAVDNYDLVQITNASTDMPVVIAAEDDKGIDKIEIKATLDSDPTKGVTSYLNNITATNIGRMVANVSFPLPAQAPSGLYTVKYTITDKKGKTASKEYKVNVLNYRTAIVTPCTFPAVALPSGKNVTLFVTTPANTNGDDLYVSGNFEGSVAGCTGDWSGGGCAALKFTKVSNTCYYIHLNLTGSSLFKITRGDWNKVMKNADGSEADNIVWNNASTQTFTVANWVDRIVLPPITIPTAAIGTGKLTVIADVGSNDTAPKYYLVKKGATNLDGAVEMIRIMDGAVATNKLAGAVPRDLATQYWVVKDNINQIAVNAYGYKQEATWDGMTNPENVAFNRYSNQAVQYADPNTLYIVGAATGNWDNLNPAPAAKTFTKKATGKFEIASIALVAGGEYLLLPVAGDWGQKWGTSGIDPWIGGLVFGGNNIKGPATAGNYKIEVDFYRGIYKLTKL